MNTKNGLIPGYILIVAAAVLTKATVKVQYCCKNPTTGDNINSIYLTKKLVQIMYVNPFNCVNGQQHSVVLFIPMMSHALSYTPSRAWAHHCLKRINSYARHYTHTVLFVSTSLLFSYLKKILRACACVPFAYFTELRKKILCASFFRLVSHTLISLLSYAC